MALGYGGIGYDKTSSGGGGGQINRASTMQTGQTTSSVANDDGARQDGRETDFLTLTTNNPFGNLNRFTDTLGTQVYTDTFILDWAYADYAGETVTGYCNIIFSAQTWANAMAGQPYTVSGYTDCYVPNYMEMTTLMRMEGIPMNYPPFNYTMTSSLWSSTTSPNNSANARSFNVSGGGNNAKTGTLGRIVRRTFTFTELGV